MPGTCASGLTNSAASARERERQSGSWKGLRRSAQAFAHSLIDPSFEVKQKVLRLVVDRVIFEESR